MEGVTTCEPLWLFGYGSLVWRPGFEHCERRAPVALRGWRRAFHQGSTDHRGVPGRPGRVVTLVRDAKAVAWGAAYRLPPPGAARQQVLEYLEVRECQYDERHRAPLFADAGGSGPALVADALLYVASPDVARNPNHLGEAPLEELAATVATAEGPSGRNCEYVYQLAAAMRALAVCDAELFALEAQVRRLRGEPLTEAPAETLC